jgi:hypothetical protein
MFDGHMGGVYVCQRVLDMGGITDGGYDGEIELKVRAVFLIHLYI